MSSVLLPALAVVADAVASLAQGEVAVVFHMGVASSILEHPWQEFLGRMR